MNSTPNCSSTWRSSAGEAAPDHLPMWQTGAVVVAAGVAATAEEAVEPATTMLAMEATTHDWAMTQDVATPTIITAATTVAARRALGARSVSKLVILQIIASTGSRRTTYLENITLQQLQHTPPMTSTTTSTRTLVQAITSQET